MLQKVEKGKELTPAQIRKRRKKQENNEERKKKRLERLERKQERLKVDVYLSLKCYLKLHLFINYLFVYKFILFIKLL